jgi:hypothetical protein
VHPELPHTVVYLGCDPDPTGLTQSACAQYANLQDPDALLSGQLGGADGGPDGGASSLHFLGLEGFARYTAPAGLFAGLPADDVNRRRGVLAILIALVVEDTVPLPPSQADIQALLAKVKAKTVASQLVVKRVRIADVGQGLNHNPVLGGIYGPDEWYTPDHGVLVLPSQSLKLAGVAAAGATETYTSIGPDGTSEQLTEQPVFSWFTSSGSMLSNKSLSTDHDEALTAPSGSSTDPFTSDRQFQLWVVARDGRGGEDWQTFPGFVCDPAAPNTTGLQAVLTQNDPPRLRISGAHTDQIWDVSSGGVPLVGSYDPGQDVWLGQLPQRVSGTLTLTTRLKNCQTAATALAVP